jgi:thioredoxin-dependent peroxiredoxin
MPTTEINASSVLPIGSNAPDFDLPATGDMQIKLSDYAGKNLVIVFYPKDKTPGCTRQLCALRDDLASFSAANTAVIASNPGSLSSHERFVEAYNYPFPILVDADRQMARSYRALKEDDKGIVRTVYIVDGSGIIRFAKAGMPTDAELLEAIAGF